MALVAANLSSEPRAFSIGPLKVQIMNFSVANLDVAGTVTADSLKEIVHAQVTGLNLTAAPTFAANVCTLAFADPGATRHGQIILFGR